MRRRSSIAALCALLVGCHHDDVAAPSVTPADRPADATPERALAIGAKVPSFQLERLDGAGPVGIPNGKVTILTFIATWNYPAKASIPKLQEIYLQYASRGLQIIAVSVDDTVDGVGEFGTSNGARYPFTWDKGHVLATRLGPSTMPTTYLIDRNAVVRFIYRGYGAGVSGEIARDAATLL